MLCDRAMGRVVPILLALAIAAASPVRGQQAAPFDGDMIRLAEILGALHYLRDLCGSAEGQKWRDAMTSLIDAEAPSGERRARIVASFNQGYQGFRQAHRTCTPTATLAIRRYLREGSKIAREVTARYGN